MRWWLHLLFNCYDYSFMQDRCICWLCKLVRWKD